LSAQEGTERLRERVSKPAAAIGVLRRRRAILLCGLVLGAGIAAAVQLQASTTYSASANVAFPSGTLPEKVGLGVPGGSSGEEERELNTEALAARSPEVARAVAAELGGTARPGRLTSAITTEALPGANVLKIIASTPHPRESARLANAFAAQYVAVRERAQLAVIEGVQRRLTSELLSLPPSSPERATLSQSLQRLNALRAFAGDGTHVVTLATPPSSPNGLSTLEAAGIGAASGLVLSLLIVYLMESLDRRVKTVEEMEHEYGLPALAAIPRFSVDASTAGKRKELLEPQRISPRSRASSTRSS